MLSAVFAILLAGPAQSDALLREGLLALDRNDLAVAARKLEQASQLKPGDARVWLALAQTYRKSNRTKPASDAAARAASLAPEAPLILHGLALFHSEAGHWAAAASFEARYAEKNAADRDAPVRAVTWHMQAGQHEQAIALAAKFLAAEERADLRNLIGKAYEAAGRPAEAVVELEKAVRLQPYEESYYFDLAFVLLIHQNFDGAIRGLEAAKKVFDKSPQLELALGVAYYGQRRFPEAVDSFLRTAALAPEIEQPYVFLGRILSHAESRLEEVTAKFAAFAKAQPSNYLAHFLHAKALAAAGSQVEAERLLRTSIALNDKYWESQFELGLLLERKRDFAAAAAFLERAIGLNPKNPAPHYRLARVYDRLGSKDRADAERALHEKLSAEEKSAIQRHAAGLKRLELVVQ